MLYFYLFTSLFFVVLIFFILAWKISSRVMYPGEYSCKKLERFIYCKDPQEEFGLAFENIHYISEDDFFVSAWFVPAAHVAPPAIILVHGWGTDRHEMMRYVPALHKAGFALLLIDLRNCGKSQKSFNSMGFHEKKDVLAGAQFLLQKKKINTLGILGISLGSATSIMSMAREPKIQAGFFEGGYSSAREVLAEQMTRRYALPLFPLFSLAMIIFQWRSKAVVKETCPKQDITAIHPRPVLIVHGTDDITVLPQNADRLFVAAREPKQLYMQKGGRHAEAWNLEPQKIEKMAVDFFKKNLR